MLCALCLAAPKGVSDRTFIMGMGPYMPLLYLEGAKGGVHRETLFNAAGCAAFEGRRLDGKVCPAKKEKAAGGTEAPKKKKKKKSAA